MPNVKNLGYLSPTPPPPQSKALGRRSVHKTAKEEPAKMRQLAALGSMGWTLRERHADLRRGRGSGEDGAPTRLTHE